jgi:hypothetical protein
MMGVMVLAVNSADVDVIVNQIVCEEPLISENKKPHLRRLIYSKFLPYCSQLYRFYGESFLNNT